jgi:hypothetical protein
MLRRKNASESDIDALMAAMKSKAAADVSFLQMFHSGSITGDFSHCWLGERLTKNGS